MGKDEDTEIGSPQGEKWPKYGEFWILDLLNRFALSIFK